MTLTSSNTNPRSLFADWRFAWFLLLLPIALWLPAMPIDETRYLSVAWEMQSSRTSARMPSGSLSKFTG